MLVSVHISKQSPLTDFTGSLHQENAFISQLGLEYHIGIAGSIHGKMGHVIRVSVEKASDCALRLVFG